jgi:hypothetical protein
MYGLSWAGLYNDQATAVLLLAVALAPHLKRPVEYALRLVSDPEGAQDLNLALKAMGAQADPLGAILVEAKSLQGRGTGAIDLDADIAFRCDGTAGESWTVDQAVLARHIRSIMDEEMDMSNYVPISPEQHWQSRWLWCVNGAHNITAEELASGGTVIPPVVPKAYRRVYAESMATNPELSWRGVSYYSPSLKHEHGKERAIYGGDTLTYVAFDRLIRPVEAAWRGIRVVLNPGANGTCGMVNRLRKLKARGGVNIMMDYDNFNSTHSIASMVTVVKVLCEKLQYDSTYTAKLLSSLTTGHIVSGGKQRLISSSLMSGHRLTTFVNSILNRAYLLVATPTLSRCTSVHVGDDVYVSAPNLETAGHLMAEIAISKLAMNPMKQSVGYVSSEFLRIASTRTASYGYFCRAVASAISGSWTSSSGLDAEERLTSMVSTSWILGNRCGQPGIGSLLTTALMRWTGIKRWICSGLLRGAYALGNGPVRSGNLIPLRFDIVRSTRLSLAEKRLDDVARALPTFATADYLTHCSSELERSVCELLNASPSRVMVKSSYLKSFAGVDAVSRRITVQQVPFFTDTAFRRSVAFDELLQCEDLPGVFSRYPILMLLKGLINRKTSLMILQRLDVPAAVDLESQCWGGDARGVVVNSSLPYSDVMALSKRTTACGLYSPYAIYA